MSINKKISEINATIKNQLKGDQSNDISDGSHTLVDTVRKSDVRLSKSRHDEA